MLAATRAPNAINRITSVIGSEVTNARLKSLPIESFSCLLMLASPTCSTVKAAIGGLCGGGGLQRRADPIGGLVLVTGDLEPKQRRMPVG